MDPVSAIVAALVAGAAAGLKGVATKAVESAFNGLKGLLSGKLSSLPNLEEDPEDEDYRKAASKELQKKGLADDPVILDKVRQLTEAISQQSPETLATAGIDIAQLHAATDVVVKSLHAKSVRVKDITARTGKIHIEDIGDTPGKK